MKEITETDTMLNPGDSMDGGRKTIPLQGDFSVATIDSEYVPDAPKGPPQDETRPLMGLGHAQPPGPPVVPEPSITANHVTASALPSSEWTDPEIEESCDASKGRFFARFCWVDFW